MSVLRELNILSQMRLDVPHIRLLESAVAGDFDSIVGRMVAGGKPLVVKGFTISGAVGALASTLQIAVADSLAINLSASESGSFLWIPANRANETLDGATNAKVIGSFVSSSVNYVGIDFVKSPDETTVDLVKFKDPVTKVETDRQVPLGRTLDYKIVVGTAPFSAQANLVPLAKITVNNAGVATAIEDARKLAYRLGSGGDAPSALSSYSWPQGRSEGTFSGADKSINNQKDWMDAVMTRMWEVGGGQNWYAPASDRNVIFTNYGAPNPANGEYFTFNSGTGAVTWQGIRFLFDGGTGLIVPTKNEVTAGSATILDGQCLYVDLDRTQDRISGLNALTMQVANLANVGTGQVPGSRWIVAWRIGSDLYTRDWRYPVGTLFQPATSGALGVVRLNGTPEFPLQPRVVTIQANGRAIVNASAGDTNALEGHGFGNGVGVLGEGIGAGPGVLGFGTGNGVEGQGDNFGVLGTGSGGGVRGVASGSNGNGVEGAGDGSGNGVQGTAGNTAGSAGVRGFAGSGSPGYGVRGSSGTVGGAGVYGVATGIVAIGVFGEGLNLGTAGSATGALSKGVSGNSSGATGIGTYGTGYVGVQGVGQFSGGNGVEGIGFSATDYGVKSTTGHVGAPPASRFQFTATKTGIVAIDAIELGKQSGSVVPHNSTLYFDATGPYLKPASLAVSSDTYSAQVRVPRGAIIQNVALLCTNATGTPRAGYFQVTLQSRHFNGISFTTYTHINNVSLTVPAGPVTGTANATATDLTPQKSGVGSDWSHCWIQIIMRTDVVDTISLRGAVIEYTYTNVDFMV